MVTKPETVKASDFKARCLELMDRVARTGRSIVVTKRGKPVAQLSPLPARGGPLLGAHRGDVEVLGDIVAPVDVAWEADD
ncbi:MAG: type II toxin-antitoxin system Phd/YefM family antitoxin [Myxococcota bacterium]